MTPYVPMLMPELQKSLVDPLPEVRAVSARAMGSLLRGMGTEAFQDLVPWLMDTLRSEGSSVERSGAAQVRRVLTGDEYKVTVTDDVICWFTLQICRVYLPGMPCTWSIALQAHLN